MRTALIIGAAYLLGGSFASLPNTAEAKGLHFSAGGIHVDVGNPHYGGWHGGNHRWGGYGNYGSYYRGHRGNWGGRHGYYHDTSHYDFHPGGLYRHRNHFHYVPDHYDYHETGHWHHGH